MFRPQFVVLGFVLLAGLFCAGVNLRTARLGPAAGLENVSAKSVDLMSVDAITKSLPEIQLPLDAALKRLESKSLAGKSVERIAASGFGPIALANPPAEAPATTRYLDLPTDQVRLNIQELSPYDVEVLHRLPPVCTSNIAGFSSNQAIPDHSGFAAPVGFQRESDVAEDGPGIAEIPNRVEAAPESTGADAQSSHSVQTDVANPDRTPPVESDPSEVIHEVPGDSNGVANSSVPSPVDPHAELFARCEFPSAVECAQCHQQIYDEWAISSHAYASISPMFQRFEDTISKLTSGTIGYFCMRCHAPVATTLKHPREQAIYDGPRVFREGVTCVACHRVREMYTKANGERRIESGDIFQPVYGGSDGLGNELAVKYKDFYKTKTSADDASAAQSIHSRSIQFEQISQSDFCMSCHQVAVPPGIKLEVVWDQYRASPAYRAGVTCQDCHMGKVPGVDGGYSVGPAAVVANRTVIAERKHSNHVFYGPGNSIAHPGIFPQDSRTDRWTPDQWLEFDWRAGWGTESFERQIAAAATDGYFPSTWSNADDRYDARELIDANLKKLEYKNDLRRQVLENGSKIEGPFFARPPQANAPLVFDYCVTNLNPGHNLPSGSLGAQPQLWLNVVLIGPNGERLWESGYLDSYGDLADIQSADVHEGKVPFDAQLFNLQTKFLTTNVKGTDREMYLPINFDIDQLPFIRPAAQPVSVINHPAGIRMEAHSLPPLGSRRAPYKIPACHIQAPGTYRLSVRLRSRVEPVYFMKFCCATPEMIRAMNESILDAHPYSVAFQIQ